jgi:hypothetical protein
MVEVHAEHNFTNGLRAQFEHVLVDIPGLALAIQLVEDGEGVLTG